MASGNAITASINALLEIVANGTGTMRRRIDASEALLAYETPAQVTEYVKSFLTGVIEDRERVHTDTRLRASTLLRKYESRKITPQTVGSATSSQWDETWRRVAAGKRRLRLDREGLWPAPSNWADDIMAADYEVLRPSEGRD